MGEWRGSSRKIGAGNMHKRKGATWDNYFVRILLILCALVPTLSEAQTALDIQITGLAQIALSGDVVDSENLAKGIEVGECGQNRTQTLRCMDALGKIGHALSYGLPAKSIPYLEQAFTFQQLQLGLKHWGTLKTCAALGRALARTGANVRAESILSECVKERNDVDVTDQLSANYELGKLLSTQKRNAEAEVLYRALLERMQRRSLYETLEYAGALNQLAGYIWYQDARKRSFEAIELQEKALGIVEKLGGKDSADYAGFEFDYVNFLLSAHKFDAAEAHARHALQVARSLTPSPLVTPFYIFQLGKALLANKHYEEAEVYLKEAHLEQTKQFGKDYALRQELHGYLVVALEQQGKDSEARAFESKNKMWIIR